MMIALASIVCIFKSLTNYERKKKKKKKTMIDKICGKILKMDEN